MKNNYNDEHHYNPSSEELELKEIALNLFGRVDRLPWFFYEKDNVIIKISNIFNDTCIIIDLDKISIERVPVPPMFSKMSGKDRLYLIGEYQLMQVNIYEYINDYKYMYEEMPHKKAFNNIIRRNRVIPHIKNMEDFEELMIELGNFFKKEDY